MVTDGRSSKGSSYLKTISDSLSKQGVNIIAVGVGSSVNQAELRALATDDANVFKVGSLSQLKNAVWSVKRASCQGNHLFCTLKSTVHLETT